MGETYLSATQPTSPMLEKLARAMRAARDFGNKARVPEGVPLIGGTGLGDFMLNKAPEGVEMAAYGEPLTTGRGQTLHLKDEALDAGTFGLDMGSKARRAAVGAGSPLLMAALKKASSGGAAQAGGVGGVRVGADLGEAPLLPRGDSIYTPDVPQVDLKRQTGRGGKYTERMQDLLDSGTARKKVDELIGKGKDLGMTQWYGTEPLRIAALNEGLSQSDFDRMLAHLSSASQRNSVDAQNKLGSYLWNMDRQGQFRPGTELLTNKLRESGKLPEHTLQIPEGLGSLAQSDIFGRSKRMALGESIDSVLPEERKLGTFYRNLKGNLQPVTVDVNAVRGPVLANSRPDPRWLESKVTEKELDSAGRTIGKKDFYPRADVAEGRMSLKDARARPGFWVAAPEGSDYAGFEDLWQRGAKRHGIAPAEAQALGWYGSADVTALKTKPELYVNNLERLIRDTAQKTGQRPTEVLKRMLRGEEYLR